MAKFFQYFSMGFGGAQNQPLSGHQSPQSESSSLRFEVPPSWAKVREGEDGVLGGNCTDRFSSSDGITP